MEIDMTAALTVTGLSKSFGDRPVLQDVSLSVPYGTVYCLMGPSGCGKTTFIRILLGLEEADAGTVTGMPEHVGCQFQEDRLCEDFSIRSNLRLAGSHVTDSDLRRHLRDVLLVGEEKTPVRALSGGMKRRVSLVRAVLTDAPFFILDEPFKGLDGEARSACIDYVRRHTVGKTVLIITHDEADAADLQANLIRFPQPPQRTFL